MTFEQTLCPLTGRSCWYDKPKCTGYTEKGCFPIWERACSYNKKTGTKSKYEDRMLIKDMKVCPRDWEKYDKEHKPRLYYAEKIRYISFTYTFHIFCYITDILAINNTVMARSGPLKYL